MKDKIIQIVKADSYYTIHGISENGNLYALKMNNSAEQYWDLICESPEIDYPSPKPPKAQKPIRVH